MGLMAKLKVEVNGGIVLSEYTSVPTVLRAHCPFSAQARTIAGMWTNSLPSFATVLDDPRTANFIAGSA